MARNNVRLSSHHLRAFDRLEYAVLRDHGHEWTKVPVRYISGNLFYEACGCCGKRKSDYLRGSRTRTAHQEKACAYSEV